MSKAPAFDAGMSRAAAQRSLTAALAASGIESAALDARLLLCGALGIDHPALVRDPDEVLGAGAEPLAGFALRRLAHEPVSRILGTREFYGALYEIDPHVLDPRADTETLVEAVIERMAPRATEPLHILDLGLGSGAILGALLGSFPQASGLGTDISPAACRRARHNLERLGFDGRASVVCGAWFAPLNTRFDVIVSNPPYLRREEIAGLDPDVRFYDPHLALDGGVDGLEAYRAIARDISAHLRPGGLVALEFGLGQRAGVESILSAAGLNPAGCRHDLAGHERVLLATLEI